MSKLSYGDFRPIRKGEAGYSPTKRSYISPSTGEILPVRQFQKRAEGSSLHQKAQQSEQKKQQKQKPVTPAPKTPPARVAPKSAWKRNLGQYVKHTRKEGKIVRTRVNARSEDSLGKQIDRTSDNSRVIFHLVNTRTGDEVRAIPNKGVTSGDLKEAIADGLGQGKSQKDAFRDALASLFRFYGVDPVTGVRTSDELDSVPDDVSNFVMYAE